MTSDAPCHPWTCHDGTQIGAFAILQANEDRIIDSEILYQPSSDDASATFTVSNAAASFGNIQFTAQSDNRRTLVVEDIGRVNP